MPISAGSRIGPYEIVGWLGAGGMGEVYRARDPRLGRDVAIKLISEAFATDEHRVRRFEQEARAAGQLNHPNILAVYDVGSHAGAPYIVSELLEGQSLRDRLRGGALTHRKAADYARQVADGLAAAHDKHFVHKDIKPDNLFITSDERVKILDFGIAKLTMPAEGTTAKGTPTETEPDMVIGSAPYMSPEQVRGEDLDARSDVFSLGSVLYEMLAGRPAFVRDTKAEMVAAILKEDPQLPLSTSLPEPLERIVLRCLEKSREARFQSARDLAFGLALPLGTGTSPASRAPESRWRVASVLGLSLVVVAAVMLLTVGAGGWLRRDAALAPVDFSKARFSYFTQWAGAEGLAEISPDGNFVVFQSDKEGEFDLFEGQVDTGEFVNLTADQPGLNGPAAILRTFGFSGDGLDVWFSVGGKASEKKRLLRRFNRTSRASLFQGSPSWSPDGQQISFIQNDPPGGGDPLFVADAAGASPRQIFGGDHNHNPMWSRDGQWIYFSHGPEPSVDMDIWRIKPSGEPPERLTNLHIPVNHLAVLDDRTVLFVSRAADRTGPWLWTLDVVTKKVSRVSIGVSPYTSVSASRDGRRIAVTVTEPMAGLWTVPIGDRQAEDADVQPFRVNVERALAPRFGDSSLFYLASRGSGDGLWRFREGEATEVWPSANQPLAGPAAVSRDGRQLAVVVTDSGRRQLVVMAADGTNPQRLAADIDIQGEASAGLADFSPDGAWIVVGGMDANGRGLFKIPTNGSKPVRLVEGQAVNPIWSPRDDVILYAGSFATQITLRGVSPAGQSIDLPGFPLKARPSGYRFLPDGKGLVFIESAVSRDFTRLDLRTGERRQLTRLGDHGALYTFDIRSDGKQIVFDRSRENSNIALIDLPKK